MNIVSLNNFGLFLLIPEIFNFQDNCKSRVKNIQISNSHLQDIPFNFLIGGDGNVYEGRGFEFQGQHTANVNGSSYDEIGICIAFIGTYENQSPMEMQMNVFQRFVEFYVAEGILIHDYKIFFQDQLTKPAVVPADGLLNALTTLENFHSSALRHCVKKFSIIFFDFSWSNLSKR
jgi:hypothetical protein